MDDPTTSTEFIFHPRKDTHNFLRICHLITGICTEIIRILFSKHIPPDNLKQTLIKYRTRVKEKLNKEEQNLIYPKIKQQVNPVLTTKDLDISLMVKLLQKLNFITPHQRHWGNAPPEGDTSIAACMEIIKKHRNEISHTNNGKINLHDFERIWGKLKFAVVEMEKKLIGGIFFQNAVEYLYTYKLDHEGKNQHENKK